MSKIFKFLMLVLMAVSCSNNKAELQGIWKLKDMIHEKASVNLFVNSLIELNSIYSFEKNNKLKITLHPDEQESESINCSYYLKSDTLKIIKEFKSETNNIETYQILKLSQNSFETKEISTGDIRIFRRVLTVEDQIIEQRVYFDKLRKDLKANQEVYMDSVEVLYINYRPYFTYTFENILKSESIYEFIENDTIASDSTIERVLLNFDLLLDAIRKEPNNEAVQRILDM